LQSSACGSRISLRASIHDRGVPDDLFALTGEVDRNSSFPDIAMVCHEFHPCYSILGETWSRGHSKRVRTISGDSGCRVTPDPSANRGCKAVQTVDARQPETAASTVVASGSAPHTPMFAHRSDAELLHAAKSSYADGPRYFMRAVPLPVRGE
jgi:hypothetical protein